MSNKTTVETRTATFHEIFARAECSAWVRLLWQDGGTVIILSDYGHWSYWWGHRGSSTVADFLADLELDYMGNKMMGQDFMVHSDEKTIKAIREGIIETRRNGDIDKDEAINEWNLMESYADGELDFSSWSQASDLGDTCEYERQEVNPTWQHFWQRLWVPLVQPELIKFAAQEKTAVEV